jgi:hypothetical protein
MQGMHAFDPKVKTTTDLESFVGEGHFLQVADELSPTIRPTTNRCQDAIKDAECQKSCRRRIRPVFLASSAEDSGFLRTRRLLNGRAC